MKSFNQIYSKLRNECKVRKLQRLRFREILKKYVKTILLVALAFLLLYSFVVLNSSHVVAQIPLILLLWVVFAILSFHQMYKNGPKGPDNPYKEKTYSELYKEEIIGKLVNFYDNNLSFSPKGLFPVRTYQVRTFGTYDRIKSQDLIEGNIDGKIPVNIAHLTVQLYKEVDSSDSSKELMSYLSSGHGYGPQPGQEVKVVFNGLYAAVRLAIPRGTFIALHPQGFITPGSKNKLTLDSAELEKNFECYTNDKMYTMSIFTAEVMECINNHKRELHNNIDIVLTNDYLSIRIHGGAFPIYSKTRNVIDYETLYTSFSYLNFICDLSKVISRSIDHYNETHNIKKITQDPMQNPRTAKSLDKISFT